MAAAGTPQLKKPSQTPDDQFSSLPQIYLGGNTPDKLGSGLSGIRKPTPKPFGGMSTPTARKTLDKARQQGDYRALPAQGLI